MGIFSRKKEDEKKSVKTESQAKTRVKPDSADNAPALKNGEKVSMKDLYNNAETVVKTKDGKKEKVERKFGQAYRVLVKPLVTEKAANLGVLNKYVFEINTSANKIEVAKAIKEIYGILPINVNIIKVLGKKVRSGRMTGKRKGWKKAVITLPAGKTINIYEGV
jgi:large subunit ribosomal protein L23